MPRAASRILLALILLPGLGPNDPRRPVDPRVAPWSGVALLQIPGVSRCTAALIAPTLALTAAHCLYSRRLGRFVPPESVHVLSGYASGAYRAHSTALGLGIAAGYDPRDPARSRASDAALVTLRQPIIPAADALALAATPAAAAAGVLLGGYSQDRGEILTADPRCAVLAAASGLLLDDCAGTRGTSGAPLLQDRRGAWRIIGLRIAARNDAAQGLAVPAATLRALLPP